MARRVSVLSPVRVRIAHIGVAGGRIGDIEHVATTNVDSITMSRRLRFGDNVRRFRHAHGMSQEQLADKAGMDRKTVNRIEQGVHSVRLDNVWLLAEALEVDVRDLFSEPQPPGRFGMHQTQQQQPAPQGVDLRELPTHQSS